jgi:hypothetical protein
VAIYAATISSARTAAQTFDYLATFSNAAGWDPGVLSGEQIGQGPVSIGTQFRLVVPFLGRRLTLIYRVTELVPGHEVVLAAASGLLRATDRIAVTARGSGATVSYQAEVRLRGPLRLLDPLLSRGFRQVGQRATAGLAAVLAQSPDLAQSPEGSPATTGP